MSNPAEVLNEELETDTTTSVNIEAPQELVTQLWPQAEIVSNKSPEIKLDIPENTAYDFAPPQISAIFEKETHYESHMELGINKELFSQSTQAYRRLAEKYEDGIKVGFPYDLEIEDLPKEDLHDLGLVLKAWDTANETYFYLDSRPHEYFYSPIKVQWDELAVEQTEYLKYILGIDFDMLAQDTLESDSDIPDGIRTIKELFKSSEFQEKENLTNYLMQEGWRAKRTFFRYNPKSDDGSYEKARYYYEYTKFEINQLLCDAALDFAEQGNTKQVGAILDHLSFSRVPEDSRFKPEDFPSPYNDATGILLNKELSEDARKVVLKEFVKVFGPISAIDTLSAKIHDLRESGHTREDPYAKDLIRLYSLLEGEDVPDPMVKLVDVYEKVDYAALERPELTAKEADRLERVIDLFAQGAEYSTVKGKVKRLTPSSESEDSLDPKKVKVLDNGAGNARVSRELFKRGYANTFALDYDPKNARQARERRPSDDFIVIRGDWHNLPFATGGFKNAEPAVEVSFTTERSFLHNRTPAEWFELYDESRRVSHYRSLLSMDLPKFSGKYKERVDHFEKNLKENFGITDSECKIIFDGPGKVKFNRMAISEEQLDIYNRLFGYVVVERDEDPRPEEDMTDIYFTLAKDQNWVPGDISQKELWNSIAKLGMFDYDVDFNMFVDSWGMTLGQALLFGLDMTGSLHSSPYFEEQFRQGKGPQVWVDRKGGRLNLRAEWPSYE